MDDFTPDIRKTLDDAVDAGELLSFRYLNVLGNVTQTWDSNRVSQSRALDADRYTMQLPLILILLAANVLWFIVGWAMGYKEAQDDAEYAR